jgi:hypothetical protein
MEEDVQAQAPVVGGEDDKIKRLRELGLIDDEPKVEAKQQATPEDDKLKRLRELGLIDDEPVGKSSPVPSSASGSGAQQQPVEQQYPSVSPPVKGDKKLWTIPVPANLDIPKARKLATQAGIDSNELSTEDLEQIITRSQGKSVGEAIAITNQYIQKNRAAKGPQKTNEAEALGEMDATMATPSPLKPKEDNALGVGSITKNIGTQTTGGVFQNYDKDQSFFAKVSEAKRKIVDEKDFNYSLSNDEQGREIYDIITNPKKYAEVEKKASDSRAKFDKVIEAKFEDDLKGDSWKEFIDGGKPSVVMVNEYAKKIARENGIPDDGFGKKYIETKLNSAIEIKAIRPRADEIFETNKPQLMKLIEKEIGGPIKFEDSESASRIATITEQTKTSIKNTMQEIQSLQEMDTFELNKSVDPVIKQTTSAWEAQVAQLNASGQQIQDAFDKGLIQEDVANQQLQEVKQQFEEGQKAYQQSVVQINNDYQGQLNSINAKYRTRFDRQQSEFLKAANDQIAKEISTWTEKNKGSNEKIAKAYQAAYSKAFGQAFDEKNKARAAGEEAVFATIPFSSSVAFGSSLLSSLGSSVSAIGASAGIDLLDVSGKRMQSHYELTPAKTEKWSDLLDPTNLAKLNGQLGGSMLPGIAASAVAARTGGKFGGGLATELIMGGLAGWFAETADIAGRMYQETLAKTGSEAEARKRADVVFDTQVKILPLYAFEALPFVSGLPTMFGLGKRAITRAGTRGAIEFGTEFMQEMHQNIFEEAISAGKNPYVELRSFAGKILRADEEALQKMKSTAISIAPTAVLGASGEAKSIIGEADQKADFAKESRSTASELAAKFDFVSATPEAMGQQVFRMVESKGAEFSTAVVSSMFTSGFIDQATRDKMITSIEKSGQYSENAKKANLNPSETATYVALSEYYEAATSAAEQETDPILKAAAEKKAARYKAMVTDFVDKKEFDVMTVQFGDGTTVIMPAEEIMSRTKNDPKFRDDWANGDVIINAYGQNAAKSLDDMAKILNPTAVEQTDAEGKSKESSTDTAPAVEVVSEEAAAEQENVAPAEEVVTPKGAAPASAESTNTETAPMQNEEAAPVESQAQETTEANAPTVKNQTITEQSTSTNTQENNASVPTREQAATLLSQPDNTTHTPEEQDKVMNALNSMKIKSNNGRLSVLPVPPFLWNGFIEAVKIGYRGSKKMSSAIKKGIKYLKDNGLEQDLIDEVVEHFKGYHTGEQTFNPDEDRNGVQKIHKRLANGLREAGLDNLADAVLDKGKYDVKKKEQTQKDAKEIISILGPLDARKLALTDGTIAEDIRMAILGELYSNAKSNSTLADITSLFDDLAAFQKDVARALAYIDFLIKNNPELQLQKEMAKLTQAAVEIGGDPNSISSNLGIGWRVKRKAEAIQRSVLATITSAMGASISLKDLTDINSPLYIKDQELRDLFKVFNKFSERLSQQDRQVIVQREQSRLKKSLTTS